MKLLREQIRKEIKRLSEELGKRKYPLPVEIRSALVNDLKLRPLIRYVNNVKPDPPNPNACGFRSTLPIDCGFCKLSIFVRKTFSPTCIATLV